MLRLLTLLAAAAALSGCAPTSRAGPAMMVAGYAFPPPAFYEFCRSERVLCSTKGRERVVELTPARRSELLAVNEMINRSIVQRDDGVEGVDDKWQAALTSGDCEDLAIRKKKELLKRGWPASALLLTVGRIPVSGVGHTVLTVRTSKGDLILDSLTSRVKNWSDTRYDFFARQSQDESENWEQIRS